MDARGAVVVAAIVDRDDDTLRTELPGRVELVNVAGKLGLDASEQAYVDRTLIELDGTDNKGRLGANSMLAPPPLVGEVLRGLHLLDERVDASPGARRRFRRRRSRAAPAAG